MFIKHLSQKKGKFGIFETAVTQGSRSYPKRCFASKDPKQARRPRAKKTGRDMWLWRSRWFRIVIWVIWMIQWHIHTNIQLSEFELSVSWSSWHKKCFQRMFRSKCFKQMQSWLKLDDFVYSAWKAWNIYWVSQNWSIGALISHYELITSKESCPRLWKDLGQPELRLGPTGTNGYGFLYCLGPSVHQRATGMTEGGWIYVFQICGNVCGSCMPLVGLTWNGTVRIKCIASM